MLFCLIILQKNNHIGRVSMKLNEQEQKQADIVFFYLSLFFILFAIGIIISKYLFHNSITDLNLQCPLHSTTGIYCPACGGTRAFIQLTKGNLIASIRSNPFVPYLAFVGGIFFMSQLLQRITHCKIHGIHFRLIYVYIGLGLLIMNALIKNFKLILSLFLMLSQ